MKVLNFGSLNLDYVYQVESILIPGETQASKDRKTFCGGKGLNQSIALAKAGIPVFHAGMIGEEGDILLETCRENGVNTDFIRKIQGPGGHTVIQVDKNGQNFLFFFLADPTEVLPESLWMRFFLPLKKEIYFFCRMRSTNWIILLIRLMKRG